MEDKATVLAERMLRIIMALMLADIYHDEAIEKMADCIREIMGESPSTNKRRKLFGRNRE